MLGKTDGFAQRGGMENANVARFLRKMAEQKPDGCAVRIARGRRGGRICYDEYSFIEIDRLSDGAVAHFKSRGVAEGQRVLLMVRPGLELILITFALFKMGAVPVVIDPGMGLKSFLTCVRRSKPDCLVGILPAVIIRHVFRPSFKAVKTVVPIGAGFGKKLPSDPAGEPLPVFEARSDSPAAILFTSGSTGPAKGVCYEHGMFDSQVRLIRDMYGIEPGEVDLPMLPVFALFNPALGMTTVVPEMNPSRPATVDPAKIVQAILQNEVTSSFGSPVLWTKIGRYCRDNNIILPSIRRILMAGAAVPPALIEMFREIIPNGTIHTPYGATECLPVSSISGPDILADTLHKTEHGHGSCVGRIAPEMKARVIKVTDEAIAKWQQVELLEEGQRGEIIVTGPVVTKEYDALPEATAKAKILDDKGLVWHRMGDLGYFDEEGRLWFCGRKAERVETAGGTMYTDCCEAVFNSLPWVYRSALVGFGEEGRQRPVIVIEPEKKDFPASQEEEEKRVAELRQRATAFSHTAAITDFCFHKSFPVDVRHNAKIHRLTLREYVTSNSHRYVQGSR